MGSEGNPKVRGESDPGAKFPKQIALLETRLGSSRDEVPGDQASAVGGPLAQEVDAETVSFHQLKASAF